MGGHSDMGTSVHVAMAVEQVSANKDLVIAKLYTALKRITLYDSPARLRKTSDKNWGLAYEEALEFAYENIQQEAKNAIRGVRLPKVKKVTKDFEFGTTGFKEGTNPDFYKSPPMMYAGEERKSFRRHWKDDPTAYSPEELKHFQEMSGEKP